VSAPLEAIQTEQLAIDGGVAARTRPDPPMFPGGDLIGPEEEAAVLEVIRSKRLFRYYGPQPGPSKVAEFEQAFAAHMGVPYAVAVSSGTGALMCGGAGIGIGPGDEVIVPAYTFIAPVASVALLGAVPILAEVDETLTLDPADVERKITPRTKAILAVHMRGAAAQMHELQALARGRDLRVIEDVAQADGGTYRDRRLGSLGDVGCYSLQFNKIITCGEGGVIVTADETVHQRALMLQDTVGGPRNHIPQTDALFGMNYRMTELAGAVALVQLGRLDGLIETMRVHKGVLKEGMADALSRAGGQFRVLTDPAGEAAIALIFFMPTVDLAQRAIQALKAENIGASALYDPDRVDYHVYAHWAPILAQRSWAPLGGPWRWGEPVTYSPDMCPRTLDLLGRAVHLNVNPLFTDDDIAETVVGLNKVLNALA
jgi:8-amino-3,8-dideoxy-alpha-D-manno-octulosonate transaminase